MQDGRVVMTWEGKDSTFWCLMQYWVGTGWQYVERKIDKDRYELWNL